MSQKRKEFFITVLLTVFMIAIAVSSCEGRGDLEVKKQWKEYLIVAVAPFVGLFLLYCIAVL